MGVTPPSRLTPNDISVQSTLTRNPSRPGRKRGVRQVTDELTDSPITGALLSGVRVLDLSEGVPGPFAAKLLAYLGAEVIKIERPGRGDASRRASPFLNDLPNPETSGSFLYLNGGKKSVTLDVATSTGAHVCSSGWWPSPRC